MQPFDVEIYLVMFVVVWPLRERKASGLHQTRKLLLFFMQYYLGCQKNTSSISFKSDRYKIKNVATTYLPIFELTSERYQPLLVHNHRLLCYNNEIILVFVYVYMILKTPQNY